MHKPGEFPHLLKSLKIILVEMSQYILFSLLYSPSPFLSEYMTSMALIVTPKQLFKKIKFSSAHTTFLCSLS
jgi:hypothetical protein